MQPNTLNSLGEYMEDIVRFFGKKYANKDARIASYDYIEQFIAKSHTDWSVTAVTGKIVKNFIKKLQQLTNEDFSFLVTHCGYIPEAYGKDSSQETLYSKLIETVVLEWSIRIGFTKSLLPTQKASMEDVSILDENHIIVCDAKSFRLGRSQGAPNVKDVLKHADIKKWLSPYKDKIKLGGLVTFPSQHDWKKGSDFYQYTTDKSSPTASLYYEHLSFFMISGMNSKNLIKLFQNYPKLFPNKISKSKNNRAQYYSVMENFLFSEHSELWSEFNQTAGKIISEKVYHCVHSLDDHIKNIRTELEKKYATESDIEILRKGAIESEYLKATEDLHKQKDRIHKFRNGADDYHEK